VTLVEGKLNICCRLFIIGDQYRFQFHYYYSLNGHVTSLDNE